MAFAAVGAIAGTVAGALYLDGKYAIRKDVNELRRMRAIISTYLEAAKNNRLSLYYYFEDAVRRRADDECIWSREGCYTWNQVNKKVNTYAQWYISRGVKPHDLVAFYLMNSPDFLFAYLGLWAIGAAPCLLNYNLSGKALLHCLKLSGSSLILVDDDPELVSRMEEVRSEVEGELRMSICVIDARLKGEMKACGSERPGDELRVGIKAKSPMCMLYTSGTTGLPKSVAFPVDRAHPLGAAVIELKRGAGGWQIRDSDRWYNCMPMYHGTGGCIVMSMLMSGITVCIGKRFSTSKFWSEVRDSRATWITYVGETARYLLAAPPSPLDKEHNVRCMYGNGLRPDVWKKFQERFNVPEVLEFFSSSEGVFGLAIHARGDYLAGAVGWHGGIGRFLNRNQLVPVLVDEESGAIIRDPKTGFAIRQPYGKGGEMLVAVPDKSVFAGYHKNPEATNKKFAKDVFKKGDLFYRSGDALRRTEDGRWYFLDRLGDTFRWKGENVSTAEVAQVIGKFPGVVEANVYGVQLPSHDGRAGMAAIFIDPGHKKSFDLAGLLKFSRTHLPKYAVPIFIRVVKEMTPIHNNKQNKVPLRAEGVDPEKVGSEDQIFWIDSLGKGHTYVEFQKDHWEELKLGRAML